MSKWKVGETGWISGSEVNGCQFKAPVRVRVLARTDPDIHPLKVADDKGRVFYCSDKELHGRAAKAKRQPAELIVTESIRRKAEEMAEQRIKEFEQAQKPAFQDIATAFYAIGQALSDGTPRIVLDLAEKALYQEIKDGCVWTEKTE